MSTWFRDLRTACRSLRRKHAFTAIVVLTLALGVGANTAIFSVVDGVLLRPLPYEAPERLVNVWQTNLSWKDSPHANLRSWWDRFPVSYPVFQGWLEQTVLAKDLSAKDLSAKDLSAKDSRVFEHLGLYADASYTVTGGDRPERIRGIRLTSGVFAALGVEPAQGRVFLPEDDEIGVPSLVVLSHGFWQRRFGADPSVIGQTLRLDREPFTIVGVMPPGFYFPRDRDVWTTLPDESKQTTRSTQFFQAIARLEPGLSLDEAEGRMKAVAARIAEAHDGKFAYSVRLVPRLYEVVGKVRPALLLLIGTVGLVLLIACANVANLLLVRATERRQELAVRTALGAGRGRLVGLLLSESMVLSSAGGALGFFVAFWGLEPMVRFLPPGLPRASELAVDQRVLFFSLAVTVLTGLLIGALPALGASRADVTEVLGDSCRVGGRRRHRTQTVLVVAEIALAFLLLVGASLLAKSFVRLTGVERGFEAQNVLLMRVSPPEERYPEERRRAFFDELHERLAALPGVVSVAGADTPPFAGRFRSGSTTVETASGLEETNVEFSNVTPSYFDTLKVPLITGRPFRGEDREGAVPVAIVSQSMVRKHWPDENPIGRRVKYGNPDAEDSWLTIVGVAADVHHQALDVVPHPRLYRPEAQNPVREQFLLLATLGDPSSVAAPARSAVWEIDRELPVDRVEALEERIARSVAAPRFRTLLVTLLAGMAAVLALVGIYGVMAYAVAQRTHEIGVRMALGARRGDVVRHVLVSGLRIAAIGLCVGFVLAVFSVRLLDSFLYEMSANDPLLTAVVAVLLGSSAVVASLVPARRAASVDPAVALRD